MVTRRTVLLSGLACAAGLVVAFAAQSSPPSSRLALEKNLLLGSGKTYRNLTLFPVYAPGAKAANLYLTLDEGLQAKVVTVKEQKEGGEVNTLLVINRGKKPLYMMGGEVVLGGQQDRLLARDTIVPPSAKWQEVPVYCVEHGRWSGHVEFGESAKMVASGEIRAAAQEGVLAEKPAMVARAAPQTQGLMGGMAGSGRAARVRSQSGQNARANASVGTSVPIETDKVQTAQQQVWDKVAKKNSRFKAESQTNTYRGVLNMAQGEAKTNVAPYVRTLKSSPGSDPEVVGVMAAVNGKIVAVDIFSDPGLFRKLFPKLLNGYAADAAENVPKKAAPVLSIEKARDFYVSARDTKRANTTKTAVSSTLRRESQRAYYYRFQPNAVKGAAGGFGGAGGSAGLHLNILGK